MFRKKNVYLWILSIALTIVTAYYQYKTGPTKPVTVRLENDGTSIKNKLIRSHGGKGDAEITLFVPGDDIRGFMKFKRYKSYDEWSEVQMVRRGDSLFTQIPHQPPAGKVMYQIFTEKDSQRKALTKEPVIMRFRGDIPAYILISHILLIFLAMLFSTRTGVEVLFKGNNVFKYTRWTIILLFLGGLIMGPIVQKLAFGIYWSGWPFGYDLTDNKTLIAFIMWVVAFFILRKNKEKTGWALAASIILIAVYLIPHSIFGSEIDYTAKP
jgi:hypothetical protein